MRDRLLWFRRLALLSAMVLLMPGCNSGFGAFQEGVGNTPNRPPLAALRVLGQPGLQFSAQISDADATWGVRAAVPLSIVIVNNVTPVRMVATKQSGGNGLLSLQLTSGFVVVATSATSDPYGTVSLQNNPTHPGFAPPPPDANPDVRLFVRGPLTERFAGLFEDSVKGFEISDRAPTLFLFDNPDGAVDATVTQIQTLGPFDLELLLNGIVVATAHGGPTVTIRQP
ncbi:MAG TPA: hypothetical protein VKV03_12120 [Candidatus Binataceae bacterium]|nr:hypothetical protein [Candidatus Binataceae bacterium]